MVRPKSALKIIRSTSPSVQYCSRRSFAPNSSHANKFFLSVTHTYTCLHEGVSEGQKSLMLFKYLSQLLHKQRKTWEYPRSSESAHPSPDHLVRMRSTLLLPKNVLPKKKDQAANLGNSQSGKVASCFGNLFPPCLPAPLRFRIGA
jgi:hypothetical protein